MNTISDISPGEFLIWLAIFICVLAVWSWPPKE